MVDKGIVSSAGRELGSRRRQVLFVGNGCHLNRGCEALTRGTMEILRREFGGDVLVSTGLLGDASAVIEQSRTEQDPAIRTFRIETSVPRWSAAWWTSRWQMESSRRLAGIRFSLSKRAAGALVALELGGDNYSLDYGVPRVFLDMDQFLMSKGVPVVLWGASVGPFDDDPAFAHVMFGHLRGLAGILVRETESLAYLERHGVRDNVHLVADPAFLMPAQAPPTGRLAVEIPVGSIGLNLSPLLAKYSVLSNKASWEMTGPDLEPWVRVSAEVVCAISRETGRTVVLLPHVSSPSLGCDDFRFLTEVRQRAAGQGCGDIICLEDTFTAAELKWVINQCAVFAGARMHALIAALSSGVPSLSISYSMKTRGINTDLFGSLEWCVDAKAFSATLMRNKINDLLRRAPEIREQLKAVVPIMQDRAWSAGSRLRMILEKEAEGYPGMSMIRQ